MNEPEKRDAAVDDDPFAVMMRAMALRARRTAQARELLRSDEAWIDAGGTRHRVADMSPRYCATVARWLDMRARILHEGECDEATLLPVPNGEQAAFDCEGELYRLHSAEPRQWLDEQPLMRALRERAGDTLAGPSRAWLARHPHVVVKRAARWLSGGWAFGGRRGG